MSTACVALDLKPRELCAHKQVQHHVEVIGLAQRRSQRLLGIGVGLADPIEFGVGQAVLVVDTEAIERGAEQRRLPIR